MDYKSNMNWYLYNLLKSQYSSIAEDELKQIYLFEITEVEHMVLWAYETDLAINKVESISAKMADEIKWGRSYRWVESWRPNFKYIKDYQTHLNDVIFNCENYHQSGVSAPFQYNNKWLFNFRDDMYNRLIGKQQVSPDNKARYSKSLINV